LHAVLHASQESQDERTAAVVTFCNMVPNKTQVEIGM
jgi:hypothetical protein